MADASSATPARRSPDRRLLAVGAAASAGGVYFLMVWLGLATAPGALNGPGWIAAVVGLIFLSTGASVLVRGWLGLPDAQDTLPDDAPPAFKAVQWIGAIVLVAGMASIATWIAFGAGERGFAMSLSLSGTLADTAGRVIFGIGAVIAWLMVALIARRGIRAMRGARTAAPPLVPDDQCSRGAFRNLARSDELTATSKVTPSR